MQGLLSALQGHMKCLPEVFDLWNLYADYFLRGGFGSFRGAKLLGLGFVSPHWADRETLYGFTKYLSWIPLFPRSLSVMALSFQFCLKASNSSSSRLFLSFVDASCSSKFLIKAVKLSKNELCSLLFIYACELSLINYIIYSIHNRIFLEVLIYLFPQRFGQFYCPSSRRNYNL